MANILIFEDDSDLAALVSEGLSYLGHETATTTDARTAFEWLESGRFDLAIVDIFIKKGNELLPEGGLSLLGRLKNAEFTVEGRNRPKVPIIAVSGAFDRHTYGGLAGHAAHFGADIVLRKPFDHDELMQAVDTLLLSRGKPEGPAAD